MQLVKLTSFALALMPTLLDYEIQKISLSPQLLTVKISLDWEVEKISPSPQLLTFEVSKRPFLRDKKELDVSGFLHFILSAYILAAPVHAVKACRKCEGVAPFILNLGTRWGWVVVN